MFLIILVQVLLIFDGGYTVKRHYRDYMDRLPFIAGDLPTVLLPDHVEYILIVPGFLPYNNFGFGAVQLYYFGTYHFKRTKFFHPVK